MGRFLFFFILTIFSVVSWASPSKRYNHSSGIFPGGEPFTITTTVFEAGEEEEFAELVEQTEAHADATLVAYEESPKVACWLQSLKVKIKNKKKRVGIRIKSFGKKMDRVGAMVALVRTGYSSVFWILIADLSRMQSISMVGLQAAIHYSFTYKGYNLNVLEFSRKLGVKTMSMLGKDVGDSKYFSHFIKSWTGFNLSSVLGVAFMGILAWENFVEVFSGSKVYGEIVYYSLMGLFATGGWNAFLSDQKFSEDPVISEKRIQRIYQFNGTLMALAFPLMMSGYQSGSVILGITGLSGLMAIYNGEKAIRWYQQRSNKKAVCVKALTASAENINE